MMTTFSMRYVTAIMQAAMIDQSTLEVALSASSTFPNKTVASKTDHQEEDKQNAM
jgi:hypothetical protein